VWVIEGEPNHVTWRPVTVVRVDDEHAYIGNQIRSDERIVALGAHLLREGERVRLADNAGALIASAHR
jgi:hypothetical protein